MADHDPNAYPSMQTWQASTRAHAAVLGEIVAALGIEEKVDWDGATRRVQNTFPDEERTNSGLNLFIRQLVEDVRESARNSSSSP